MATKQTLLRHLFAGGWATDFGPSSDVRPERGGTVNIPFLVDAEDLTYDLDGGPQKAPGTAKLNSSALESGATVKGIYDYWISGTGGSPAQKRIIHVGTTVKKDDADGTFTNIFTGFEAGKVPSYTVLEDLLIIASDSTSDVPSSWDGSTAQSLAGSPPNFAFCTTHKNRVWASGNVAKASRLYYCGHLQPENWTGSGSGHIDIDPDDGDIVTGIASHRGDLFVFKGPNKGSIHRITGSAPTGGDPFAKRPFDKAVGAVGHNTIFHFADDLGFIRGDGHIGTISATDKFGDFSEATLSRPIQKYIDQHVNFSRLKHAYATNWPARGIVLFSLPIDSSNDPNVILMMDYRFNPVRWSKWPTFSTVATAMALVVDSAANNKSIVMGGGSDGFVRKFGQSTRSIDGDSALSYKVVTPFLTYSDPWHEKVFVGGALGLQPLNNGDITYGWQRDAQTLQTRAVAQSGGDVLGGAPVNEFTLGTSVLGGATFIDNWFDQVGGGAFRAIQYSITHTTNNADAEVHSLSAILEGGTASMEN